MSVLDSLLEGHVAEAFMSGGGFNAGKHPRGGHGYFVATGSSGAGVKRVQGAVGAKQDGKFGTQTKAKVAAYQKAHGLTVDGVVGRQTAASLLGNKKASTVKIGAMTAKQASQLGAKHPAGTLGQTSRRTSSPSAHPKAKIVKPSPHVGGGILVG